MYSSRAIVDLQTFLAGMDPRTAATAARRIFQTAQQLTRRAAGGPSRRLRSGARVRSWPIPPLRLYYRRTKDTLQGLRFYRTT